jgi:hypothetical protein
MQVFRLLYLSTPPAGLDADGLEALVRDIRIASLRNNAARHLTGVLAYSEVLFAQALEGDESDVAETFARIRADSRHRDIHVVHAGHVSGRAFPDWAMAFARVGAECDLRSARPSAMVRVLLEAAQKCEGVRALPGHGLAPEARRRTDLGLS